MRAMLILFLGLMFLIAFPGCSDKQKEADRLEQEMQDLEAGDSGAVLDSAAGAMSEGQVVADAAAIPEEAMPIQPAMPPVPEGEGYTVQVASCESEDYARHLVSVYTERGYQPFVTTITYNDQTYHRVRIGSFDSFSEAKALENEIVDRYSVDGIWVDRLDQ